MLRDFSSGAAVKTLCLQCRGPKSITGWETEIPYAMRCGKKKKRERERAENLVEQMVKNLHNKGLENRSCMGKNSADL